MENRSRVLLILSQDALGQARVLAGTMTATLRISVSLQIILRALIEHGLKRRNHPDLAATIEAHATAIRHARREPAPAREVSEDSLRAALY